MQPRWPRQLKRFHNVHRSQHSAMSTVKSAIEAKTPSVAIRLRDASLSHGVNYTVDTTQRMYATHTHTHTHTHRQIQLECGPMPNVMAALPNIGGILRSTPQSLADAHY